jgi:hypothetical protein
MNKMSSKQACRMAVDLIEEQLSVLPVSLATAASPAANQAQQENAVHKTRYQRILAGNALLAVWVFLKEHGIAGNRTPEIQFLGHICNAIINANTFHIASGYVPGASFSSLTIDSTLDGALLFGDGANAGFMEPADAVALLQWLAQSLRGTQEFVSGGDAG